MSDKIVLSALGHDRAFAIVEVFSPVNRGHGPHPWDGWHCDVRPVIWTTYERAPGLAALGEPEGRDLRASIRQQSHIKLMETEYWRAVEALEEAGAERDGFYRP